MVHVIRLASFLWLWFQWVCPLMPSHNTGLEKVNFNSNPKEKQCWRCSNYHTIVLISHASKVMLKILQARLQQYVNHELPDVQAGFRKGRGTRDQMANICWIIEKHLFLLYWLCQSLWLCGSQQTVENSFFFPFFKFYFIFKLYNIVLVLTNIKMNPPQVYMCSPSWTLLPPPSPYHPSGSSKRDGNTRPPDLPLEKPICRSGRNS